MNEQVKQMPAWKKTLAKVIGVVAIIVVVAGILCAVKPTKETMIAQASDEMQEMIKEDETSTRKRVTTTYNSLIVINYCSFTSSGQVTLNEKYVGFAGKVYKADEGAAKVAGQMVNYTYRMLGCGENILHGAKLTIVLTVLSTIFGVVLGTLLALGKMSKNLILSKFCQAYIFFFRGTPLLIQLFVIYFTVPGICGFAWRDLFSAADNEAVYKGAFLAALIAFALNSGAYCAEIVRAAIQSIDKGQMEASKALGMNYRQSMTKVIIPQSIRRMIPPVCNEFIMILKDASLVFAISLMDITTISKNIMTSEGSYLVFIPALVIYLIITGVFTFIFNKIEKKFSVYE
ncbi:amino acid ABC transporter permease [Eubacterium oxidoreducens]|uniref:Amine acid ABC transporter, permease protein, 3-TM region, His/Glu/Gln/Arg/opine family n=1 Tax=Eubacterium oxidoreducens TaxID=1732 RepID=A0A1G6ABC4_EUBOX|nr:amino acid ABC transporter permease [Eubacterium oxidoreducens]SDB05701.1 amine acid ABC transporter, permease protein, 3-TM region, His/Glu/Gln/Arg/opine family [Eubacterium oxidoreducens]